MNKKLFLICMFLLFNVFIPRHCCSQFFGGSGFPWASVNEGVGLHGSDQTTEIRPENKKELVLFIKDPDLSHKVKMRRLHLVTISNAIKVIYRNINGHEVIDIYYQSGNE